MESNAWKELHALDLVSTPRIFGIIGCGLLYNRHGQWLGIFPNKPTIGRTFRENFRSEKKALLQVLIALWQSFLEDEGDEADGKKVQGVPVAEYVEYLIDLQSSCLL